MAKTALVGGRSGHNGACLAEHLLERGVTRAHVVGSKRRSGCSMQR